MRGVGAENLWWAVPLAVVTTAALLLYDAWYWRASEAYVARWAEENGLTLLLLKRQRLMWRPPPGVTCTKNRKTFQFAARDAAGRVTAGWVLVRAAPMSLRPGRLQVILDDSIPSGLMQV